MKFLEAGQPSDPAGNCPVNSSAEGDNYYSHLSQIKCCFDFSKAASDLWLARSSQRKEPEEWEAGWS